MDTRFLRYNSEKNKDHIKSVAYNDNNSLIDSSSGQNPFRSFWMAGFECTDKLNAFGNRVDFLNITGHLQVINEDYKRLSIFNISTVREGIRWSQVEKVPYQYDWSEVAKMIECGRQNNIQQVWDLCHFGFPNDLTPLHPMFARRFASLCRAFVHFYRSVDPDSMLIVTPINEVSFLSWLGGDVRGTSPYCLGQGWEVKYKLMKAYIEGVEALKEADPSVRILTTEPLVNIVPPENPDQRQIDAAGLQHDHQFQVTDILCGKLCPELRGKPDYLDILGYNYYYNNQWVNGTNHFLNWTQDPLDSRYAPLHSQLTAAYSRYECPLVITETSHPKEDRPLWIEMVGRESARAIASGIPLWGICWYPVVDRPDWDHLHTWHQSGLWDGKFDPHDTRRVLHVPTANALLKVQDSLKHILNTGHKLRHPNQLNNSVQI